MTYIFKQGIFILICLHYYCLCYNNFNELKSDMELKVTRLSDAMQSIYADKYNLNIFSCPVKSFNVCEGTDQRICMTSFPVASNCPGISKYSMTSGIRIPNSVASFNLSQQMKFFICKTAEPQVQSVLQQLLIQDEKRHAWINLASNLGVSRISPGFKYEKENATSSCKNFDPRLRPWYSQNTYGRKKIIIIVQNSKGIYDQPNRFASIQMSLQAILKTSQPQDLFNVIQFSDSPRLFFSEKDMKLVSLSSQYQNYDKATNYSGLFYESVANNITKSKSIEGNYKKALQLALKVFENSRLMNPEMENFILFFAGFKPTNFTANYSKDLVNMLAQKETQLSTNFLFFGFGVNMHDDQGVNILNSLACKYDGIYTELFDVTYQSMFLDQASAYYDYLTQGNQINGCRWSNLYQDALGLGKMVSVIKPSYYQENNVTKLIGAVAIDVLAKQLTTYLTLDQIQRNLQVTKIPFKKNVSLCALQNIRGNYRCHKPQLINCTVAEICTPSIQPANQSVIQNAVDTSDSDCCIEALQNFTGLIIGIVLGVVGAVFLIALAIYCLIFRKRKKDDLQKTYAQIFSQFKDFDQTRIRSQSQISIIKD